MKADTAAHPSQCSIQSSLRAQRHPKRAIRDVTRTIGGVFLKTFLGIALICAVASGLMALAHVRLNTSPSLPLGLYRDVPGRVTRGSMVVACLPSWLGRLARARHYIARGTCPGEVSPVGKIVLAMLGDTVAFTASGIVVNGRLVPRTASQPRDHAGRLLPHYPFGTMVLRPGAVVLYAPHEWSLDARYAGPIALSDVRTVVRPLWTAHARPPIR